MASSIQLLRLGLTFDHKDADGETWTDYQRGVTATFTDRQATEATIADMDTKDSETITATRSHKSPKSRLAQ